MSLTPKTKAKQSPIIGLRSSLKAQISNKDSQQEQTETQNVLQNSKNSEGNNISQLN